MGDYEADGRALAARLGALLLEQGKTLALAESCTGGLAASLLTDIAGSSEYFLGSAVTYAYSAKEQLLGVAHETLMAHGAVSAEVAQEMAQGARRLFGADLAVAITGIAGPGGGAPEKPVGLVYLHLSAADGEIGERYVWDADRVGNKLLSARAALALVLRYLEGETDPSTASLPKGGRDFAQDDTGASLLKGGRDSAQDDIGASRPKGEAANLPDFPDAPVAVELRLLPGGQVAPEAFTWLGRRYVVTDVGRQWVDEIEGVAWRCYLVRALSGETFELRGDLARDHWVVARAWPHRGAKT